LSCSSLLAYYFPYREGGDAAVLAAYGWPDDLSDEETLQRLLELNLEPDRAATPAER